MRYRSLYQERCAVCSQPLLSEGYRCSYCEDALLAYGPYRGILQQLVNRYKSGGELLLCFLIASLYKSMMASMDKVLLLPIPASKEGRRARGFDQVKLVCRVLSVQKPCIMVSLFSLHGRGMQKRKARRLRILSNRLKIREDKIVQTRKYMERGYQPIIIDDVVTTTTTVKEAQLLFNERFGSKSILMVLART